MNIKFRYRRASMVLRAALSVIGMGMIFYPGPGSAILVSLKTVQPPVALNIGDYMSNQFSMERLGKALFWDMQVGSDGVQACATCHFHAGADSRTRNQLSPGLLGGDEQYGNNNLGSPPPAPGSMRPFQGAKQIDDSQKGNVIYSSIAIDSGGKVHTVFKKFLLDKSPGQEHKLYYSRFSPEEATLPGPITVGSDSDIPEDCKIAIDNDDNIFIAYTNTDASTKQRIYFSRALKTSSGWSDLSVPEKIDHSGADDYAAIPDLFVKLNNDLIVTYLMVIGGTTHNYYKRSSSDKGTTLEDPEVFDIY